jgi:hypothetical protein
MKLRIKGNTLRLRVSRSELDRFSSGEPLEETIHFGPQPEARLTYALEWDKSIDCTAVKYRSLKVTVQIPYPLARTWMTSDMVGLSSCVELGATPALRILVEKDFACLDGSESDNEDTFPNPNLSAVC